MNMPWHVHPLKQRETSEAIKGSRLELFIERIQWISIGRQVDVHRERA
jgi:hypothetical protein